MQKAQVSAKVQQFPEANYLDMVGVRGSIPLAPTISLNLLSIVTVGVSVDARASLAQTYSAERSRTERQQRRAMCARAL
jgi:hypothetical protein